MPGGSQTWPHGRHSWCQRVQSRSRSRSRTSWRLSLRGMVEDTAEGAQIHRPPVTDPLSSGFDCVRTHARALQNRGQGLGFKFSGLGVVDKKALAALAAKLCVVIGTVITALLAIAEEINPSGDDVALADWIVMRNATCDLSATQKRIIQAVPLDRDVGCSNNISLADMLDVRVANGVAARVVHLLQCRET